jgi:hypothetical protein
MSALAKITITVGNRERTSLDLTDDEAHLLFAAISAHGDYLKTVRQLIVSAS